MKIVSYTGEEVDIKGKIMGMLEFEGKMHQTKKFIGAKRL